MTVRRWGEETLVNTNVTGQTLPTVVLLADAGGDGSSDSIKMQRYDAAGDTVGGETHVNTTTLSAQMGASARPRGR